LRDHERRADASPDACFPSAAPTALQRRLDLGYGEVHDWHHGHQQTAKDDRRCRHGKDRQAECDVLDSRDAIRYQAGQDREPPARQRHTQEPAARGDEQAFGGELPGDSPASSPERGADRKLLRPSRHSREREIRDVGARDQQQTTHRSQRGEKGWTHGAHEAIAHGRQGHRHAGVCLGYTSLALGERRELRLRLLVA
jgi:hypothetical protein